MRSCGAESLGICFKHVFKPLHILYVVLVAGTQQKIENGSGPDSVFLEIVVNLSGFVLSEVRQLIPSQRSSGNTIRPGSITKTGNTHARKALVSATWKYIHCPRISVSLGELQKQCSARTVAMSQQAQKRLHKRYRALTNRKPPKVAVVALARELVGFLWETMQSSPQTA